LRASATSDFARRKKSDFCPVCQNVEAAGPACLRLQVAVLDQPIHNQHPSITSGHGLKGKLVRESFVHFGFGIDCDAQGNPSASFSLVLFEQAVFSLAH
jgi:hypothetical protein